MKHIIVLAAVLLLAQAPPLTKAEQLQDAARKGDAAAVKKLLDEGVDVNTKFRYNATALFYACDHGHLDVVKVLLDRGADMGLKDTFYGFTPLMLATDPAQKKTPAHTEIAKLLIAKGAPDKEVAVTSAVEAGDAAMVKFVLDSGIAPAKLTDPLEAAKAANKADIVALLEKAGAKPYEDFKIDPAMLAKFAGAYRSAAGTDLTIVLAGARISVGQPGSPPAQRFMMIATGEKAFKGMRVPVTLTFQVEGDKVVSFTMMQGPNPTVYTRVEGK